jgi:molecular chaperone IbpA
MRTYDLNPLFRSVIGFDRFAQALDEAQRVESKYPPYNIEVEDTNKYKITMAVAGFDESELEILSENDTLKITGRKVKDDSNRNFLHRGLGTRDFEQRFQLADHVRVAGASLVNGLLYIDLVREVPEALKPRKIAIGNGGDANVQKLHDERGDRQAA